MQHYTVKQCMSIRKKNNFFLRLQLTTIFIIDSSFGPWLHLQIAYFGLTNSLKPKYIQFTII